MAGKTKAARDAITDFFDAAEALSFREMLAVGELIGMQLAERGQDLDGICKPDAVAQAILDAGESWSAEDED